MTKRRFFSLVLCLLCVGRALGFVSASRQAAPRKLAVLIGVTALKYTPSRALKGPTNDVAHMRDILVDRFGFAPADIVVVEKQAATKAGIIHAIETQLIAKAQPGDLCVFFYSGHGEQIPDQPPLDEADGLDEVLVPYDANVTHGIRYDTHKPCDGTNCEGNKCDGGDPIPSTLLIDDELSVLLSRIKTDNVVVLLDSCHSGTATRGGGTAKRWLTTRSANPASTRAAVTSDDLGGDLVQQTVLTAAASDQKALDWPFLAEQRASRGQQSNAPPGSSDNMGALTYYLIDALQSGKNLTYRQVMAHVAACLSARGFDQTPQLEGSGLDRVFLSVSGAVPPPPPGGGGFAPFRLPGAIEAKVVASGGKTARVHAVGGRLLASGSVFSAGTTALQIEESSSIGSESRGIVLGNAAPVPGQVLKETFRPLAAGRLRVAITGLKSPALLLETSLRVSSARRGAPFEIVAATEARDCDLDITQALSGGQIVIVPYRNQQKLSPIAGASVTAALPEILSLLDNLAATTLLSGLENPSSDFAVEVNVDGKESTEVTIDDMVTFTARASRDCYLYLVDIDPAGKVTVLFPNKFSSGNKLTANKIYNMPLPDVYRLRIEGPAGPEVVKAIATVTPLHLGVLDADKGSFGPLTGKASQTARTILEQLRQGINTGAAPLPAGASATDLAATAGWATAAATLRVLPKPGR